MRSFPSFFSSHQQRINGFVSGCFALLFLLFYSVAAAQTRTYYDSTRTCMVTVKKLSRNREQFTYYFPGDSGQTTLTDSSKVNLTGVYKKGRKVGRWVSYWSNGQKSSEGNYCYCPLVHHTIFSGDIHYRYDGPVLDGKNTEWRETGQLRVESFYKKGKLCREIVYAADGTPTIRRYKRKERRFYMERRIHF